MIKLIRLFLAILLMFSSCSTSVNADREQLITNDSFKYWLNVKDENNKNKAEYLYYFDTTGQWLVFMINYTSRKFEQYSVDDILLIETWELVNDSIIDIGTAEFEIIDLTKDKFTLQTPSGKHGIYIVAPDSLIPEKYKTLQKSINTNDELNTSIEVEAMQHP